MDPVLLILAGVAAFIIFRLISIMGARTGHEQRHDLEALERAAQARGARRQQEADSVAPETTTPKPVSSNARRLREADTAFDEKEFLNGAKAAYEMIVEAFASGDIRSIRPYIGESVYEAFKSATVAREEAGHTTDLKFVGVDHAAIVDSSADSNAMTATVEFISNQVRATRDGEGNIVSGDPNRIDLVKDRWTFSRKVNSRDPNWTLVATSGAD